MVSNTWLLRCERQNKYSFSFSLFGRFRFVHYRVVLCFGAMPSGLRNGGSMTSAATVPTGWRRDQDSTVHTVCPMRAANVNGHGQVVVLMLVLVRG